MKGARNPGVAHCVKANKNSIGYVDISDARNAGLTRFFARIGKTETVKKNGKRVRVTKYILPSLGSGAKAGNLKTIKPDLTVSLTACPAPGAYPITTTTWIARVLATTAPAGKSSTSREDVKKVLNYVYSQRRAGRAQVPRVLRRSRPAAGRRGQGADQEDQVDGDIVARRRALGPGGGAPVAPAARRSGLAADRGYLVVTALAAVVGAGRHRLPDREDGRRDRGRSGAPSASGASSPARSGSPTRRAASPSSGRCPSSTARS